MGRRSKASSNPRARIEHLEPRQLLSFSISGRVFVDLNADGRLDHKEPVVAGVQVFLDVNGTGRLAGDDPVVVTDKHGNFHLNKLRRGTYRLTVQPPSGMAASSPANGEWVFTNLRHGVARKFGLASAPAVTRQPSDVTPPVATLSAAPNVTAPASDYDFTVTYQDETGVALASLANGNVVVSGPGNFLASGVLLSTSAASDGSPCTATYRITPPDGTWTDANDGTYTIALDAEQVRDVLGNAAPAATLGAFTVAIASATAVPPAPAAPVLLPATDSGALSSDELTQFNNASSDRTLQFQVDGVTPGAIVTIYVDDSAIGAATASDTSVVITTDGQTRLADGVHSILARQVSSNGQTSVDSSTTSLHIDTVAPSAQLAAPDVSAAHASSYNFSVTYSDDVAIDAGSLGSGSVEVDGPNGFRSLATLVTTDAQTNGPVREASYAITPPGGTWDAADDGLYTVSLETDAVRDTAGNAVAAGGLGTFQVAVTSPGSAPPGEPLLATGSDTGPSSNDGLTRLDNATPASALQFVIPGTLVGATVQLYADGQLIAAGTASGPATTLSTDGSTALADGAHTFVATQTEPGLPQSAASLGRIITIDADPPAAAVATLANVGVAGGTTYSFSVTYSDDAALDVASTDGSDVVVVGPGTFSQSAALVSVSEAPGDTRCTATYSIAAPGGQWTASSDGTYTITLHGAQVFDQAGNAAPQGVLGQFTVVIASPSSAIPAAPALLPSSDTGASNADGLTDRNNATSSAALAFSVANTTPGAVVTLYADGTQVGQATVTSTTTIVSTDGRTSLRDGTHQFTVRQQTPGGGTQSGDSPKTAITIDATPPTGSAIAADVTAVGANDCFFRVTWSSASALDVSALHDGNVIVTGPNGYSQAASFVTVDNATNGSPRTAVYQIRAPGDEWTALNNGTYTIRVQAGQIGDLAGNVAAAGTSVGSFHVNVPAPAPAFVSLSLGSMTGNSSIGPVTNLTNSSYDTKLQFNVSGVVAGAIITLYADGRAIGSATASMDPMPIATDGITALGYGPHTITARLTLPNAPQSADSAPLVILISP